MRPVLSYPSTSTRHRHHGQNGNWERWRQSPYTSAPGLLPSSFHNHSSDRYNISAPQRRVPRVVPNDRQEKAFSEIMNGAFDLKRSPMCLGKRLANIDTTPASNWLLQQPGSFGARKLGKRAASSQITPPVETYKKANSSSSGGSNQSETVSTRLECDSRALNPVSVELTNLAQLIQQNTEQSTELKELLSRYLSLKQEELSSRQSTDRGSNRTPEQSEDNGGMLSPGPHVANGGGESPDPPHGNRDAFKGHMIDCVEVTSESRSNSDVGTNSTKATSVDVEIFDPACFLELFPEKPLISPMNTVQHRPSSKNSISSESSEERKNRFERSPKCTNNKTRVSSSMEAECRRRAGLCRGAPSPGNSPPGKQIEFEFFPRSPSSGSLAGSSTNGDGHPQPVVSPMSRYSPRRPLLISSTGSSPLIGDRHIDPCISSEFMLPYYAHSQLRERSYQSWGSSPQSP
ncbi:hypothetical protein MaudCBS49596_002463 [Microsporum audouinii]